MNDEQRKTFSVSIVFYDTDAKVLEETLVALKFAAMEASQNVGFDYIGLYLINNSSTPPTHIIDPLHRPKLINNKTNLGYGAAHNHAILATSAAYHLILNPDAVLDKEALSIGLQYLQAILLVSQL